MKEKMLFKKIYAALKHLKQGKMIILTDHQKRENEADIIFPAEKVTAEKINFMLNHCSGIICLALPQSRLKRLGLPLMVPQEENTSTNRTAFTLPIEAKTGVTTGVSAHDRARTIQVVMDEKTTLEDLVKPGHVFPLQAKNGGVLERPGHTEGSIDLVKLAGFKAGAVLCELMNRDGTMMRKEALQKFSQKYKLPMLTVDDIIHYRLYHESLIADSTSSVLPLIDNKIFDITIIKEKYTQKEHVVLSHKTTSKKPPLVRLHSACVTGDVLGSLRCDCHAQLQYSLTKISQEGGVLIYLNQEGRDIGLFNKIKAYALQDAGFDTVEANLKLNLPADARSYAIAAHILKLKNITTVRLLTNNPSKINDLKKYGLSKIIREPIPKFINIYNQKYIKIKQSKLKHL